MSAFTRSRHDIQDFLTGNLLGTDDEDVGRFYGLDLYQNHSFLVSNIGVFEAREGMKEGGWSVRDVGFSAGAIRAVMGDIGPAFNVASVRGGGCVVVATWEEGVLREGLVGDVLDRVHRRLRLLVV